MKETRKNRNIIPPALDRSLSLFGSLMRGSPALLDDRAKFLELAFRSQKSPELQ